MKNLFKENVAKVVILLFASLFCLSLVNDIREIKEEVKKVESQTDFVRDNLSINPYK